MEEPLRVLVVEHRHADRAVAEHLLRDYEFDFAWQSVASPLELAHLSADFDPNIVLCSGDISMTSDAVLDSLRLLCSQTPVILVSSVCEVDASAARNGATLRGKPQRRSIESVSDHSEPHSGSVQPQYAQDITHLRRCFSSLLDSSSDPAVMSSADGWITRANVGACHRLGESSKRCLGTLLGAPVDAAPRDSLPSPEGHRLAYFDAWTHHPTLIHVHDLIGRATGCADAACAALAMVALNLGSARISDDALPYAAGADVHSKVARYGSIVRIAPDDFLLVLPPPSSAEDAANIVQTALESIAHTRVATDLRDPVADAAAGAAAVAAAAAPLSISVRPLRSNQSRSITSLYRSGFHRRARLPSQSDVDTQPTATNFSRLGADLDDAMKRHALSIQYQPQFELHTGRGCGVEALARWTLATGQIVAPSVFIPLAERLGTIHALGAWVLKSACETAYAWCSRDAQRTTLSVNVSAHQINEAFCTVIERTLKESHFPAGHLELEITESALVGNTERTIECLKQWKRLGVQIAVDDFGTGYSSLNYLSRLPVDRLKLDQSLIHQMTLDARSKTVMRSTISLGADLGIDVIAEGVETEDQFQMLEDLGCPRVQGFLLGRPMPPMQAQLALRKAWGNRPSPSPAFLPNKIAVGEFLVQ
jgi:EAL domain-containing protein (putative c-di-GMP-specific phosphodiesterase class I)/PAS domain-containing protein